MNAEQALAALDIARRHYNASNYDAGIRFAKKSLSLHPTAEATTLLAKLEQGLANDGAEPSTSTASSTNPRAAADASSTAKPTQRPSAARDKPVDDKPRDFTPAQAATVKRVRACRVTQYYEILGLEKSCSDNDVKKAYRKVLSDSNKRAVFDSTGGDPDSRGGGGGGGPSFARAGGMGPTFEGDELSPEDLFRFFFGQGGGSPFGGGPFGHSAFGGGFGGGGPTFQFYGPGMSMGGQRRRATGVPQGQRAQQGSIWLQIAPLLLLFLFSFITQLPSLFGSSTPVNPDFAFERIPKYNVERTTSNMGVKYYVNPAQFAQHPIYEAVIRENPQLGFQSKFQPGTAGYRNDLTRFIRRPTEEGQTAAPVATKVPAPLAKFERSVENAYVNRLQSLCRQELLYRDERLDRARGFLGAPVRVSRFTLHPD
ncbi:Chaperone protein dnaJ [Microbotryomycetes sp. JL201]|nr:Chaperone protein dnaJ [Microbotryomycetes sp. JL201]